MGDFVQVGDLPAFNMEMEDKSIYVNPSAPWSTVTQRFDESMNITREMLIRLVGEDGESGYLGELNNLLETYAVPDIGDIGVNVPDFTPTVPDLPSLGEVPDLDNIPDFTTPEPVLDAIPQVNLGDLKPGTPPNEVNPTIDWDEVPYNSDVYVDLLTRVLNDIKYGATGLDPDIEQEIWDRALNRQQTENDDKYREIEDYFAARNFTLPPGAMAGRLAEANSEIARNNTEINGKIAIEQANLAQNNSQFIIKQAIAIEILLREFNSKQSDRSLDKEKAIADLILKNYTEKVRAFLAIAEGNKIYIQVQVEYLNGVVQYNKGLIDTYRGLVEAYSSNVNAIASKNKSLMDGFNGEIGAFEAKTRANSVNQTIDLENYKTKLQKADLELREALSIIDAQLKGYEVEMTTREAVASSMAGIASQAVASALSSVNASASLGYSGQESISESFGHNESQSESLSYSAGLTESHSYEET